MESASRADEALWSTLEAHGIESPDMTMYSPPFGDQRRTMFFGEGPLHRAARTRASVDGTLAIDFIRGINKPVAQWQYDRHTFTMDDVPRIAEMIRAFAVETSSPENATTST